MNNCNNRGFELPDFQIKGYDSEVTKYKNKQLFYYFPLIDNDEAGISLGLLEMFSYETFKLCQLESNFQKVPHMDDSIICIPLGTTTDYNIFTDDFDNDMGKMAPSKVVNESQTNNKFRISGSPDRKKRGISLDTPKLCSSTSPIKHTRDNSLLVRREGSGNKPARNFKIDALQIIGKSTEKFGK